MLFARAIMIKIALIFGLCLSLYGQNPFIQKLPFKEAILVYKVSGNQKGFETLYVKDYGKQRVLYKDLKNSFLSKKKKTNSYTIMTPRYTYFLDQNQSAKKVPNLKYLLYIRYKELPKNEQKQVLKNLKLISNLPITTKNFKISKNYDKINNIPCDLLIQNGKKNCYAYDGELLLSSKVKFLGFNKNKLLYNLYQTKVDPNLFRLDDLNITFDKQKSVKLYELSKTIINILKHKLNQKTFLHTTKKTKEDIQEVIKDGVEGLEKLNSSGI